MTKHVTVETHGGELKTFVGVTNVKDDQYKISLYGPEGLEAIFDKGDVKTFLVEREEE